MENIRRSLVMRTMSRSDFLRIAAILALTATGLTTLSIEADLAAQVRKEWKIHDLDRPQPPIVGPGTASTQDQPGRPPSDAIVLFDGKDLSRWRSGSDEPAKWKVEGGYMETVKGSGYIHTAQPFGDCQLHVEWRAPVPPVGEGQG